MHPDDIGRLISLSDPAVSPDGATVAFVVAKVDLDANRYRSAVWTVPADGSTPARQLTSGEHGDGGPAWSPDGRTLAITRTVKTDDGPEHRLVLVPVDRPGEPVTLVTADEGIGDVRWSPDGRRLAYVSRWRGPRFEDGKDDAARPPRRIDRLFTRLDSVGAIADRPSRVWVVPADGSEPPLRLRAAAEPEPADAKAARAADLAQGEHGGPTWSSDSRRVAFTAPSEPDADLDDRIAVHVADLDPATVTETAPEHGNGDDDAPTQDEWPPPAPKLAGGAYAYLALSWSPDGTKIAGLGLPTESLKMVRLVVLDAETGERTLPAADLDLSHAPFPGARHPVWDGDDLIFTAEDRGTVRAYRVPSAGGEATVESGDDHGLIAAWDRGGDTLAAVVSTPDRLGEIEVLGPGDHRRITQLTDAFHRRRPAHATERFSVPSPSGDGDLDAWLVRPTGASDEAASRPLLVSIHGGPHTQYGERWFDEVQMWATAGYHVVFCEPHGATGRTEAFMASIRSPEAEVDPGSGWGGQDMDDVLAVLDATLDRYPFLDPERVGVLGGSYGGFSTTWLVGHSDKFAAACSERAANNLVALEFGSDAGGLFGLELGVDTTTEAGLAEMARMSPISYVDHITTPMLLLHSEEDWRCPVAQADELFVALRLRGRTPEYHRFPGESHELSRGGNPKHRVQRAKLIIDFFDRHLKPGHDFGTSPG